MNNFDYIFVLTLFLVVISVAMVIFRKARLIRASTAKKVDVGHQAEIYPEDIIGDIVEVVEQITSQSPGRVCVPNCRATGPNCPTSFYLPAVSIDGALIPSHFQVEVVNVVDGICQVKVLSFPCAVSR